MTTMLSAYSEKFKALPVTILKDLKRLLNDESGYANLKTNLEVTSLYLEKDGFQIRLSSIDDLEDIKKFLNKEC